MNPGNLPRSPFVASLALGDALALAGCNGGSGSTTARFTASATAAEPGLVKLVQSASAGGRVVVQVRMFGPEADADLHGFRFGVQIGDPGVLRFVPQSSYEQTALVAGEGQTIAIDVDGASDPSLVQVETRKLGGGAGNGVPEAGATVLRLAFDLQREGTSTLTLVGLGADPALAFDANGAAIDAVSFDAADAAVTGVSSGGGGY
jgi:hypothetical protein